MPRLSRRSTIDPAALFAPLDDFPRIALAVSGGPDSLALMLLAHRHAETTGTHGRFIVYSVDHGLRPEAADEVAFVVAEAERLGFAARGLRWDGDKPETGVQAAARAARYGLFAKAMAADGAAVLATAHHLADQAETVLMRLAHGSGIEGLRGMDYFSTLGELRIVRPLLRIDPAALRAVVDAAGLVPVSDPSNADLDYERVRWRRLLPQLAELGLTPQRLQGFAARMRDADTALVSMTAGALSRVAPAGAGGDLTIGRDVLRALPRAVAVRVVASLLDRVGGGRKPHALGPVEELTDRLIRESVRTTLHGCLVRSGRDGIRFTPEPGRAAASSARRARAKT